ncbi:MAG: hypothetical protein ACRCWO_01170, partial [Bosea sp. (in: a-proteobacteria)]
MAYKQRCLASNESGSNLPCRHTIAGAKMQARKGIKEGIRKKAGRLSAARFCGKALPPVRP